MKIAQLKPYYWTAYPLGVLILIVISLSLVVGGENQVWIQLLHKRQQNSENQKTLARLNTKLAILKQVNSPQMTQDLSWMLQAMPDTKRFDLFVNELRFAAQAASSQLVSYKSLSTNSSGFTLQAQFTVPDFTSSQKLIATLQNTLPLLAITNLNLSGINLSLTVTSAWAPVVAENVKIDDPLPDALVKIPTLKSTLSTYQMPVVIVANSEIATPSASAQFTVNSDPFGSLPGSN